MSFINKKSFYYPWLKLVTLGFLGGVLGSYFAVFCLDFFNPLDLFVPPTNATSWAITCGFLGLSTVNSLLLAERFKRFFIISFSIYIVIFVAHSIVFKHVIPGVGKLYELSGWGLGFALILVRRYSKDSKSRIQRAIFAPYMAFIVTFIIIEIRYFARSGFIFEKPIDLEIWFTWTIMCTWIAAFIGLEDYIP